MSEAVVLSGTGGVWRVRDPDGSIHEASMRGRLKSGDGLKLSVGDHVTLEHDGAATIAEILPRHSTLARREPGNRHRSRVVVANIDQVELLAGVHAAFYFGGRDFDGEDRFRHDNTSAWIICYLLARTIAVLL